MQYWVQTIRRWRRGSHAVILRESTISKPSAYTRSLFIMLESVVKVTTSTNYPKLVERIHSVFTKYNIPFNIKSYLHVGQKEDEYVNGLLESVGSTYSSLIREESDPIKRAAYRFIETFCAVGLESRRFNSVQSVFTHKDVKETYKILCNLLENADQSVIEEDEDDDPNADLKYYMPGFFHDNQ